MTLTDPHDYRIALSESFFSLLQSWNVKDILEVGAGDGKNLSILREQGFHVEGIEEDGALIPQDIGIQKLSFDGSLPFPASSFDVVYSFQYLNHGTKEKIVHVFGEVLRMLRPGGHFVLRITDFEQINIEPVPGEADIFQEADPEFGDQKYRMLGPQLFTKLSGDEAGVPHYAFIEDELVASLASVGFKDLSCKKMRWNLEVVCKRE